MVDAQLPPALADWFRSKGHQAEHVSERLGADGPDTSIAQMSIAAEAIVISKDKDFVRLQVDGKPQLVWVRIGNTANRRLFLTLRV